MNAVVEHPGLSDESGMDVDGVDPLLLRELVNQWKLSFQIGGTDTVIAGLDQQR